uniref:Ubiquitin carboxyl-terminal hydrolase 47 n=1 Tax=Angiostrongylus costaricensis TaxID=334426 RepID=A0A158PEI1_ANGCS
LGGFSGCRAVTYSGSSSPSRVSQAEDESGVSIRKPSILHRLVARVAMTCYLNSLVQSLYMTPEFRNAIYNGKFGNIAERETRSIPYQIQKLFLLLQTSELGSLETRDLTASFGWSNNEAYDQHDVQELCRLMFDALELKWRGTQNEKLIENLYRGKMQDFVKCFKCGRENVRPDVFLDLPLAVKPFGAMEAFRSVEEALQAFITPELLDGSNQYFCENCNSKEDAHKGLRVTEFPYLLTIQLKRFDFDYNTMHRIKLNDRVTFPDVLDLNPFVYSPNTDAVDVDRDKRLCGRAWICSEVVMAGQQIDRALVNQLLKRGEYVYELFSVMVHQGSAAGGHYFAHIKNMDQGQWYCFNDTRVESVSPEEISKSFGGSYGGWSTSNTNAYMLMYRKVLFNRKVLTNNEIENVQNDVADKNLSVLWSRLLFFSVLQLDVDSRLPFGKFKAWLGQKLSIDPAQFVVVKHYKEDDKGYECNSKDDENVRSAFDNVFKIGIKLRPPLREDEKLIRIVQFDLEELNRENWKVLFECAASKETTVRDLMLQCIHLYAGTYGQQLQFNQIRLREMPSLNHPMKAVLDPADTLDCRGAQWSNNIYFQIITDEHLIGAPGVPVLVRRFRPSTVEVSNIQEVLVDPDATSQMESLAYGVSSLSGIPVERLAFTEIGSSWEKWPFALSRLAMLDGSVKFFEHPSYAPNDVIDRVGGRVIYYRDIAEVPKQLSIEDRKQIQIKEHGQSMSAVARRRERPLRIQMSSISEP